MNPRYIAPSTSEARGREKAIGLVITLSAAFFFALVPIWVRFAQGMGAPALVFFRALIGSLFLALPVAMDPVRRQKLSPVFLGKNMWLLLGLGLSMAGCSTFYFLSIRYTTVAKAVLLNYTAPIYVVLFGPFFLGERASIRGKMGVALGITGMALIVEPAKLASFSSSETVGVIYGIASGLCLSGIFLFGKLLSVKVGSYVRTIWGGAVTLMVLVPWGVVVPPSTLAANWIWLVTLGTLSMALPYTLFFKAQDYIPAHMSSTVALFEPACGVVIGYLAFNEALSPLGMAGAACILAGIYLSSR